MRYATSRQVQELVDSYNSSANLVPGEKPITVAEMCEVEGIIIVECPHPVACEDCYGMNCMVHMPWE